MCTFFPVVLLKIIQDTFKKKCFKFLKKVKKKTHLEISQKVSQFGFATSTNKIGSTGIQNRTNNSKP